MRRFRLVEIDERDLEVWGESVAMTCPRCGALVIEKDTTHIRWHIAFDNPPVNG